MTPEIRILKAATYNFQRKFHGKAKKDSMRCETPKKL